MMAQQWRGLTGPQGNEIGAALGNGGLAELTSQPTLAWIGWQRCGKRVHLLHKAIADRAGQPPSEGAGQSRILGFLGKEHLTMESIGARFLTRQKSRANLHALRAQGHSGDNAPAISNAASGDDRGFHPVSNLGDQRKGSRQRIFGCTQEGGAMTTRFKTGYDDQINVGLFQRQRFGQGGGRADGYNVASATFLEDFRRRNTKNEAKDRRIDR